jgi:hypothetical protein
MVMLLCFIATSVTLAAPSNTSSRKIKLMKTNSIVQLKKLKFANGPRTVLKAGVLDRQNVPPDAIPKSSNTGTPEAGNEVYRTGDGLVLKPSAMSHPATLSWLIVFDVTVYASIADVMQGRAVTESFGILLQSNRDAPTMSPLQAYFRGLPSGLHTYVFTLSLHGVDVADHIVLQMGANEFDSSDYVYNPTTGDIRFLFTYDAGAPDNNNELVMRVKWRHNDASMAWYQRSLEFFYVQLAQLD